MMIWNVFNLGTKIERQRRGKCRERNKGEGKTNEQIHKNRVRNTNIQNRKRESVDAKIIERNELANQRLSREIHWKEVNLGN